MAWLLVVATIPAGLTGLTLEHALRTLFAKPLAAAIFLTLNGLVLLAAERLRRQAAVRNVVTSHATVHSEGGEEGRRLEFKEAVLIGIAQSARCSPASAAPARRWWRPRARPRSRRCGTLLVPARHPDHRRSTSRRRSRRTSRSSARMERTVGVRHVSLERH